MDATKNILNEAPASATLSVVTPKGFNTLFTIRDMSVNELIKKITIVEEKLDELGYKPQVKQVFGQKKEVEYVEGKVCPKDGGRLIKKLTKDGKPYHKCENGKWNPVSGPSGCDFVDWLEPKVEYDHKKPYSGKTISVEEFEDTKYNQEK
jgi:hypothetical protein